MGIPKLLKGQSGRRGSNPRRPAWEVGCQLNLKTHHVSGVPFRNIKNPTKSLSRFKTCLNAAEMRQSFWFQEFRPSIAPGTICPVYDNTSTDLHLMQV